MSKRCDLLQARKQRVGNNVSHSNAKSKRMFHLNLQSLTLYSAALKKNIKIKTTARTIRTIYNQYLGSIDDFLYHTKAQHLTEWALIQRRRVKKIYKLKSAASV